MEFLAFNLKQIQLGESCWQEKKEKLIAVNQWRQCYKLNKYMKAIF